VIRIQNQLQIDCCWSFKP